MTKARARERAKAKAAQKNAKRKAGADQPAPTVRAGQFDPGSSSIKSPAPNANIRNVPGVKRGSARSR